MIVRHTTMIILLIVSLIAAPNIIAENIIPDSSHQHEQLMCKDLQERQPATDGRIQELERSLQKSIDKYDEIARGLGKHSDKYKDLVEIHNQSANTGSSIASTMQIASILIAIISTVLIVVITHFSTQYFRTITRVNQLVKRAGTKQQLDILMARTELSVVQQGLERTSREAADELESNVSARSVEAAYMRAFQIRSILEEMRSGEKNVDIQVLCDRLKELSDMDTEKTWTKDVREYLYLLLSGEILNDDSAKQAVKNLLRNL